MPRRVAFAPVLSPRDRLVGEMHQAERAGRLRPTTRRMPPQPELPPEVRVRQVFREQVVHRLNVTRDRVGKLRVNPMHEHPSGVRGIRARRERGRVHSVLGQITDEVGLDHDAHRLVRRLTFDEIAHPHEVGEISRHEVGVLRVGRVGGEAVAGSVDVVPHEERDHAQLQAFADVAVAARPERRGLAIPVVGIAAPGRELGIVGTVVEVDVTRVHAAVERAGAEGTPHRQVVARILADRPDREVVPASRATSRRHCARGRRASATRWERPRCS